MKVGVICEGEITDAPMLEAILTHKFPNTEFRIIGRDKKAIFSSCHIDISWLLDKGFRHIAVIWDLLPVGKQMAVASQWNDKPNRREQKITLLEKIINSEGISPEIEQTAISLMNHYGFAENNCRGGAQFCLKLICICYMMDGWLLSDEVTIKKIASTDAHKVNKLPLSLERPDSCQKPAALLARIFYGSPNKRFKHYNKYMHNIEITEKYISDGRIDKMEASASYVRLIEIMRNWGAT